MISQGLKEKHPNVSEPTWSIISCPYLWSPSAFGNCWYISLILNAEPNQEIRGILIITQSEVSSCPRLHSNHSICASEMIPTSCVIFLRENAFWENVTFTHHRCHLPGVLSTCNSLWIYPVPRIQCMISRWNIPPPYNPRHQHHHYHLHLVQKINNQTDHGSYYEAMTIITVDRHENNNDTLSENPLFYMFMAN